MTQEKGEQRYFPKPEELAILVPKLKEYFKLRERSNERKDIVNKTYELVKDLNPEHWSAGKVRLWFNNNKTVYLGKDQRRVPTPILKANKLIDPNQDITIEKNATPGDYSAETPTPLTPSTSFGNQPPPLNNTVGFTETNPITETKPYFESSQLAEPSTSFTFSNIFSPSNSIVPILSPYDSKFSPNNSFSFGLPPLSTSTFNDIEQQSQQQEPEQTKEINLPEVPDKNADLDNQKYQLYESLKVMYNSVNEIGDLNPKARSDYQKKLEERMTQVFKHAHEVQCIKNICSNDTKCTRITTANSNTIQRQYSNITRRYADDVQNTSNVKYEETSPHVYVQANFQKRLRGQITNNLLFTLRGECDSIDFTTIKDEIECSSFSPSGDVAYVFLDGLKHAHMLHFNDMEVPTGFYMRASSIYVDDNGSRIFVAGDCRIKCFSMQDLSLIETFQTSTSSTIISSCLTVFDRSQESTLVFGSNGSILMWDVSNRGIPAKSHSSLIRTNPNKDIAKSQNLDLSQIEWSQGRQYESSFKLESCISEVTSLCCLKDYVAIASKKHHSIHLFDKDKMEIAGRLIGHVEGITRLHRLDGKTLLSSSKDYTLKIWDVEHMVPTYHLIRHSAKITSVTSGTYENDLLIFSGAKDGIIFGWDIPRRISIFQIRLNEVVQNQNGMKSVPLEIKYVPHKNKLTVVLEKQIIDYKFKTT